MWSYLDDAYGEHSLGGIMVCMPDTGLRMDRETGQAKAVRRLRLQHAGEVGTEVCRDGS